MSLVRFSCARSIVTLLVAMTIFGGHLLADQVVLSASKDNTMFENSGDLSNGAGPFFYVGKSADNNNNKVRRALIRFDLSSLPAAAVVTEVQLKLFVSKSGPLPGARNVTLHAVTADWGEGASDAGIQGGIGTTAKTGDATWTHRFFDTASWTAQGGDFKTTASATTSVGAPNQSYSWSGSGLVADVKAWLANPASNFGWVVRGDEANAGSAQSYNSRENTTSPPELTVTYTVGPTSTNLPDIAHGPLRVDLRRVAGGLVSPVAMVSPADGTNRSFIVEQTGQIRILQNGKLLPTPFLDVSNLLVNLNSSYDERGLLGLAFDPGFTDPQSPGFRRIFTYSSEPVSGSADLVDQYATEVNHHGVLASWKVNFGNPNIVDPGSRSEILRIEEPQVNHNGGTIAFGPDGFLYIGFGDGGGQRDSDPNGHNPTTGNAQDTTIALGKMLRIDVNGTNAGSGNYGVPSTNPYFSGGGLPEIYAVGFRNPYRFSFDGNDLYVADVGQNAIEEVNKVELGKNYGWRLKEGSFKYNVANGTISTDTTGLPAGLVDPVLQYDHDDGISVIGGFVYRGTAIPELIGKYVFGDFSRSFFAPGGRLFYADFATHEIREFVLGASDKPLNLFIKGMGQDEEGELYVLATTALGPQGTTGVVLKIVPPGKYATGSPVPGAGEQGTGVPADAKFRLLGIPSLDASETIAFSATYTTGKSVRSVLVGPLPENPAVTGVVATVGDQAPGGIDGGVGPGELFASFQDPVLAGESIGFFAKLKTSKPLPARKDQGVWTSSGEGLHLIAREGDRSSGTDNARFGSFISLASEQVGSQQVKTAFTANLAREGSLVTSANDMGLWISTNGELPALVLREQQSLTVGAETLTVRSFQALAPASVVAGQGHGLAAGKVAAVVTFTNGTQALVQFAAENDYAVIAKTGDALADGTLTGFGPVSQDSAGRVLFVANVKPVSGKGITVICRGSSSTPVEVLQKPGDSAAGTDGTFSSFSAVVGAANGDYAFLARASGGTVKTAADTGVWWMKGGTLLLVAQESGSANGVAGGRFATFKQLALPDGGQSGPLFIADLRTGAGVTATSKTAMWGTTSAGTPALLVRAGVPLEVSGVNGKLRSFTALGVVRGSAAQTRSFSGEIGQAAFKASFKDGTQAVVVTSLP